MTKPTGSAYACFRQATALVRIGDGEGRYGLCNSCLATNCSSIQSESPSFNVDFHYRVILFLRAHVRKFLRVFK